MIGADNIADATEIYLPIDSYLFVSDIFPNHDLTAEPSEPLVDPYYPRTRSAWFKYDPDHEGDVTFNLNRGSHDDILVGMYALVDGLPLDFANLTAQPDIVPDSYLSEYTSHVTNGFTYYIQLLGYFDDDRMYALDFTGPQSTVSGPPPEEYPVSVPEFNSMYMEMFTPDVVIDDGSGPSEHISVPSFGDFIVEMFTPTITTVTLQDINIPEFNSMYMEMFTPEVTQIEMVSVSPTSGSTIPTGNEIQFRFMIDSNNADLTIEIEVDDNILFSSPSSQSIRVADTGAVEENVLDFDEPLTAGATYYWRYRVYPTDTAPTDWWSIQSIRVSGDNGAVRMSGSWNVVGTETAPVIWFLYPASGQYNDSIQIIGTNLNKSTAAIFLGTNNNGSFDIHIDSLESVDAWEDTPPIIDETTGTVTVEHDVITFTVPEVDAPGDEIVVVT